MTVFDARPTSEDVCVDENHDDDDVAGDVEAERRGARARARARAREGDGDARERGDQTVEDARLPVGIGRRLGVAGEVVRGERHASWRGGVQHVVERVSARRGKEARARAFETYDLRATAGRGKGKG